MAETSDERKSDIIDNFDIEFFGAIKKSKASEEELVALKCLTWRWYAAGYLQSHRRASEKVRETAQALTLDECAFFSSVP